MVVLVIIAVAGLGAAVYGAATLIGTYRFLGRAQRTEGTIISWNEYTHGTKASDTADYPVLRFRTPAGRVIETEAQHPLSHRPRADEPVPVLFDPDDPHRARVPANGGRGYLTGTIFLLGGVAMGTVAVLVMAAQ